MPPSSASGAERIIVVGAGPCAAVAARELVRAGREVTMLDAGRRAPRGVLVRAGGHTALRLVQPGYIDVNRQNSATDPNMEWKSSHSLGGLTNYWTGAVPRFHPDDFIDGARVDERYDWPIRYDDLVPFYELVEDDLQITAGAPFDNIPSGRSAHRWDPPADWQEFAAAVAQHGDSLCPAPIAKGRPWMVALRPREFTSYHCIIRPLLREPNFRLVTSARVLRVNHDATSGRAASVDYLDRRSNTRVTVPAHAVVVAAGAIDTTEILLRSVSDAFPTGLGNTDGVLGGYLHDHPKEWWPVHLSTPLTAINHPMVISREAFDASEPMLAASLTIGLASGRDRLRDFAGRRVHRVGVQVLGTMIPSPDRRISLSSDVAPDDPRSAVDIDLRFDDAAVSTLLRARNRFQEIFAATGHPVQIGPFHELSPGSSYHLGGTVRMHERREFGVLDAWNRVHDVPNVVVCDASCFTTGPEKNPTLTAMAIAARAARRLAADCA